MADYPPPPYRIKMVESIELPSEKQRKEALKRSNYNLFNLRADEIFIDLLTDSGTGAMSANQWASLMVGDESYANAKSFQRFQKVITEITGMKEIIPAHQGRAAENILFGNLLKDKPGTWVISNQSFDTTVGHILYNGAEPVDILIEEGKDPQNLYDFKGNMDIEQLNKLIKDHKEKISAITLVLTNNAGGGQPVSLENIRNVSAIAHKNNIPFYLDIARFVENAYFIQQREKGYENLNLKNIIHEICGLADAVWMSAKKDAFVNIGGFIGLHDSELAVELRDRLILFEGFPTYGGLAGRDLEAIATGLEEAVETDIVSHRVKQVQYLVERLNEEGIPVVLPPGGHAAFIDAKALLPHIPPEEFPAQALACELYLEGGIRSVEIGSLMFGREQDGVFIPANMELVRLAIPRRTYEKAHFDYIVNVFKKLKNKASQIHGLKIVEEPELLRHFTSKLSPIEDEEKKISIHNE